ncbi:MAG: phytanoyl-CoA dioxygenase family protein [Acidimicrobiales bacterium]
MDTATPVLSPQQVTFFETFGFLRFPGLFTDIVEDITAGFERVFAAEENLRMETFEDLHGADRRIIIPAFITKDPYLHGLLDDPRVTGIVSSLLGPDYEYAESDGNLFDCESHWHSDIYGASIKYQHLKLSFYLDPLRAESGAIRVMPGTNSVEHAYATAVRRLTWDSTKLEETFGMDPRELPGHVIESDPGDLILWDFRTIHASYGGGERRRLFSVNFRERMPEPAEA